MVSTRSISRQEKADLGAAIALSTAEAALKRQTTLQRSFRKTKSRRSHPATSINLVTSELTPKISSLKRVAKVKVVEKKTYTISLALNYRDLPYAVLRKYQLRSPTYPKSHWPYLHLPGLKFGHKYWKHLNWKDVTEQEVRRIHQLLVNYHKAFDVKSYVAVPAHATTTTVTLTVDVVIQTIFAQTTGNGSAIDTHSRLCNAFPYTVNGMKLVGKIPNWHDVRHLHVEELELVLEQGGMQKIRAQRIMDFLDNVYTTNEQRRQQGIQRIEHDSNPPDTADFVPGMLSLDFLLEGDNSTSGLFGRLTRIPGIGTKSAMCILTFSLGHPFFVVDVHIMRFCKWLGWLPEECNDTDKAACYLHDLIPDDIKFDLHNQLWTHGANENTRDTSTRTLICGVCGSNPPAKHRDVQSYLRNCPLTEDLPLLEKRWPGRWRQASLNSPEETPPDTPPTPAVSPKQQQENHQASPSSTRSTPIKSPLSPSTENEFQPTPKPHQHKKLAQLLKTRSIRFEEVAPASYEEILSAGYRLFMFRPMDNSFMQEQGTFDAMPRFRFEKPDVMDADVAVSIEYARAVVAGRTQHIYGRITEQEVAVSSTLTALAG